jgi:hypothetical protein
MDLFPLPGIVIKERYKRIPDYEFRISMKTTNIKTIRDDL